MVDLRSTRLISPLGISAGYLLFGVIWIPTTDIVLATVVESQQMPTLPGLIKGWTFIGMSSVLIFYLSHLHQRKMAATQASLQTANQQLQVLHRVFRHNIRNDMNVVLGYADLLSERASDERSRSYLAAIRESAEQIIAIGEKLKAVENVDPTRSTGTTVDLVEFVETELESLRDAHPDVAIGAALPDEARIAGDESIRYAVREVLENAIDHSDNSAAETELSIRIERVDGAVLLEISDNGPGIPREEIQALQLREETPLVHASSVGLWLVTWLTRMHAGTVTFDTDDGTAVVLRFPAEPRVSFGEATPAFD